MKLSTKENYRKRLLNVIDYMHEHISDSLDVNTLADIACMSPYHFHRIYRQMAHETVNATVRRMRLQAAASDLIRSSLSLREIAKKMSYSSDESFNRAFHKEFGETPGEYRVNKHLNNIKWEPFVAMLPGSVATLKKEQSIMFNVEIIDITETTVLGMPHQGDYMNIGQAFEKMAQYAVSHNLFSPDTKSIGIYYDDPMSVDKEKLRSLAGISLSAATELVGSKEVEKVHIPEGKYATVLFKGSYAELEKPYDWLFGQWLPESGYEAGDFPPFEEYLNDAKSTPPSELLTRIHCLLA